MILKVFSNLYDSVILYGLWERNMLTDGNCEPPRKGQTLQALKIQYVPVSHMLGSPDLDPPLQMCLTSAEQRGRITFLNLLEANGRAAWAEGASFPITLCTRHHAEVELCQESHLQAALPCWVRRRTMGENDIPRELCNNAARAVCDLMLTSSTSTLPDTSTMPAGTSVCQEQQRGSCHPCHCPHDTLTTEKFSTDAFLAMKISINKKRGLLQEVPVDVSPGPAEHSNPAAAVPPPGPSHLLTERGFSLTTEGVAGPTGLFIIPGDSREVKKKIKGCWE
ncbi:hypothetical protein QYF61_003802, partial [Mycteria americana]